MQAVLERIPVDSCEQGELNRVDSTSVQFSWVAQSCPTLCNPMNRSTPGLPVHHQLLEFTQTHAHPVSDAIQPSHPLSSPSPPAPNPSQHQAFSWTLKIEWDTEETKIEKNTCVPLFIAALFTISRTWKLPRCPLTDEWIKKLWYICTQWNITEPFKKECIWVSSDEVDEPRSYYTELSESERER